MAARAHFGTHFGLTFLKFSAILIAIWRSAGFMVS